MIKSFEIDHTRLKRGFYVSRVDYFDGTPITTYDIRVCLPNEPMSGAAAHTIEHIGADILRNGGIGHKVVYFGPMGCLTGFYLLVAGRHNEDVLDAIKDLFDKVAHWGRDIPGATERECGNYKFHDLTEAKRIAEIFLDYRWEHEYPR